MPRMPEVVEIDPINVPVARLVLRRPGDHARRVFVLELQRVGHRGHLVRSPTQHRHVVPDRALAVQLARQVVGRGLGRARPMRGPGGSPGGPERQRRRRRSALTHLVSGG